MNKKLSASMLVVILLGCSVVISNSRTLVTTPVPGSTVNIPPGSSMYIAPNNADPTFASNLQDRMNYVGLFLPPYSLSITSDPSAANYWLVGGSDEIFIPDGWIVGTLYVVNPSTKQILNAYTSRASYPTYDEVFICRKLAQNGLQLDVHY